MKRWLILPAVGAALYGLARSRLLKREVKGATTRAPEFLRTSPPRRRSPTRQQAGKIRGRDATSAPRRKRVSRRDATRPRAAEPNDPALEEHLALRAKLGTVLDVIAGVHANAEDAELDVKGIDAQTHVRVRPADLCAIVDRAAAVFDRGSTD
jgi:hypothetical protein